MSRQVLCKRILEVHYGLVEERAGSGLLIITIFIEVDVVNVDHCWIVDFLRYHFWQEVAEQAHETFDVLFSSEEDFLARDGWLPQLSQRVPFLFVEDTLIQHETLSD